LSGCLRCNEIPRRRPNVLHSQRARRWGREGWEKRLQFGVDEMRTAVITCFSKVLAANRHETETFISAERSEWTSNVVPPGSSFGVAPDAARRSVFADRAGYSPAVTFRVATGDRFRRAGRRRDGCREVNPTASMRTRHFTRVGRSVVHDSRLAQVVATITRDWTQSEATGGSKRAAHSEAIASQNVTGGLIARLGTHHQAAQEERPTCNRQTR